MLVRPFKNWIKTFQILPEWRNFAKSGHTDRGTVARWVGRSRSCAPETGEGNHAL